MKTVTSEAAACEYIIGIIYDRCRIRLHNGKEALIKARLGKRMRHHGFADLAEYCDFLQTHGNEDEFTLVVDALTTNFTNFLREQDHFEFMVEQGLAAVLTKGQRRFNVWSAASSSGEEPYTIAMYLAEHFPLAQRWDWRITGSDISTKVLAKARLGVYAEERISKIPNDWLRKYFQKGMGQWDGHYRVQRSLAERVSFLQLNLIESYAHAQPFELIFCRNVMIYFDDPAKAELEQRFVDQLAPGGHLYIGHSERLVGTAATHMIGCGQTIYAKREASQ